MNVNFSLKNFSKSLFSSWSLSNYSARRNSLINFPPSSLAASVSSSKFPSPVCLWAKCAVFCHNFSRMLTVTTVANVGHF